MGKKGQYRVALSFWTVGFQYLMLVENVAQETTSDKNALGLTKDVTNGQITEDELLEATRWSDYTSFIPLLFNLYHGIELLVKRFLLIAPNGNVKASHGIQGLCRHFSAAYPDEKEINAFFQKYTEESQLPSLLSEFLSDNALTFDALYQSVRYPSNRDFVDLNRYMRLKYRGQRGVAFFQDLHDGIKSIPPLAVRLARSLEASHQISQQAVALDRP